MIDAGPSAAEWIGAVGGASGALFAGFAVLQVVRVRRDEQRDRRTAVTAWAQMAGLDIRESGVTVTVRNDTDIALPEQSTVLRIIATDLGPSGPLPNETRYAGIASQMGPMVPPRSERSVSYPGRLFRAYGTGWSPISVSITFPDSTGQIWTRHPNGALVQGLGLNEFRTVAHVYEEASKLESPKGLRGRWHRRQVLRGKPPRH